MPGLLLKITCNLQVILISYYKYRRHEVSSLNDIRNLFQIFTRRFGFLSKDCCQAEGYDISLVQSHILYEVDRQAYPSMQQVADTLGTDITTFSRQVQSLVKRDLVKKTPDAHDRRVYLLSLTDDGKRVIAEINRQMNDYLEQIFAGMNESEKDMVIQSIQLLNENIKKTTKCCSGPLG